MPPANYGALGWFEIRKERELNIPSNVESPVYDGVEVICRRGDGHGLWVSKRGCSEEMTEGRRDQDEYRKVQHRPLNTPGRTTGLANGLDTEEGNHYHSSDSRVTCALRDSTILHRGRRNASMASVMSPHFLKQRRQR